MSEQEKKRQRIYDLLNIKIKQKKKKKKKTNPEIIAVSLWPPSSPDFNPLDYIIRGILENINANSHSNIGSLKTTIEEFGCLSFMAYQPL